jgi:hypothetical protein
MISFHLFIYLRGTGVGARASHLQGKRFTALQWFSCEVEGYYLKGTLLLMKNINSPENDWHNQ